MIEQPQWIPYTTIEWNDPENNVFSIDTRDFHAGYYLEKNSHKDFETLKKYPHFFNTENEVKDLLDRYFNESGGKRNWRFFNLEGCGNWNMKYIRIWRTELGFIICDSYNKALKKDFLNKTVSKDYD